MNSCLISIIFLSSILTSAVAQSENHTFSVKDDIAMARFSDPSPEQNDPDGKNTRYSPDGTRVAIVTTRGLLDSDKLESTIFVFDTGNIAEFLHHASSRTPRPRVVAVVAARPNQEQLIASAPMIQDLRWSSDSKHLYFRAKNSLGAMQLDEVETSGDDLRRLTPADYSVDRYDVAKDAIAYTAARLGQPHPPQGERINRDAYAETGYRISDILFPGQLVSYFPETFVMGIVHRGDDNNTVHQVPGYAVSDISLLLHFFPFRLSPDAHRLILTMPVRDVPDAWKAYDPAPPFSHLRLNRKDPTLTNPNNGLRPRQYMVIDLATGNAYPLVKTPNARSLGYASDVNAAAWAPDESRVLITNVFLPLDSREDIPLRLTKPCVVASVDLPSLYVRCLFFQDKDSLPTGSHVDSVRFNRNANEVLVSATSVAAPHSVTMFRLRDGIWKAEPSDQIADNNFTPDAAMNSTVERPKLVNVFIKQSLNDPPTLWASDPNTGAAREFWDPNPQLQHVRFGSASVYHWKDRSGRDWTGGLVKPVDYLPGKRYPLVIQMYQFEENEFLTDGTDPTAFAARELASVGFVVLQIRRKPSVFSEADPATHLEGYRSAIENLSDAGLIDPHKVGVVGFSWTCWYVINALIKAPKLFAAATIADGLDNSYMQYVLFGPGPANTHEQMDHIRGGSPFGSDQERWFKEAPGFHLDQVQTPVRIEAINPGSVLQEWELYSSLYMQDKPVDLIYFPEGTHIHQRPLERLESQQGNIDWLRFWLQGYEDPDPHKRAEYKRWETMKDGSQPTGAALAQH